jgi:hypothetical protein
MTYEGKRFRCDAPGCNYSGPLTQAHVRELCHGYTKSRAAGGANAVIAPEYTGKVYCLPCFGRMERGEQLGLGL